MRLVRAGVDDIITLDVDDDVSRISQILLRYCNRRATSNSLAPLRALLSAEAWATLTEVFEQAESPIDVSALAQLQSCTPRTVRRRFRLVGLPPPHELIAWCRMIHAFGLIDAGRSVEAAARILGFSSGAALRRNLRILTGLTPTELARAGGVGGLIDRLAGRLSRCAQPQCATDSKRNLSRFDAGFGRPSNGNSSTGVLAEPTQAETSERSGVEPAVG